MNKHYHEILDNMATDSEVENTTLFGQPILNFTQKELAKFIVAQEKEHKKKLERTKKDYGFLGELRGMTKRR